LTDFLIAITLIQFTNTLHTYIFVQLAGTESVDFRKQTEPTGLRAYAIQNKTHASVAACLQKRPVGL
jgi:hypothetical protein